MSRLTRDMSMILTGLALGALLTGGAVAAGIVAQPAWSPIYVDGRQVQMTAYNIAGNNYVKLRDIGKEVGFNVYYDAGVQVDSKAPYTGEAPAQIQTASAKTICVSSNKGNTLAAGDRSLLIISPAGPECNAVSDDPKVVALERVTSYWVAVAKAEGTAEITVTNAVGDTDSLKITVGTPKKGQTTVPVPTPIPEAGTSADLTVNMEIRQEMIRRINQVRRENGVAELAENTALMDAAQDCAQQGFRKHDARFECESALRHGYPYGFGSNLTVFTYNSDTDIAQRAASHWKYSPGHFQTMIAEYYDSIGIGVMLRDDVAYCYMLAGGSDVINPYA